jgi:Ala-tRNA(Pro) deacylase
MTDARLIFLAQHTNSLSPPSTLIFSRASRTHLSAFIHRREPHHGTLHSHQNSSGGKLISGREVAKTVVVEAGKEYFLIVLPSSCHVKPEKLAQVVGRPVRLATEAEFASLFPDCELGTRPPLGELYGLPVYVDESLSVDKKIIFSTGTHRDAIRMKYDDFVKLARPTVSSFAVKRLAVLSVLNLLLQGRPSDAVRRLKCSAS